MGRRNNSKARTNNKKRTYKKDERANPRCESKEGTKRDEYQGDTMNDISWYSRYPNLLVAAGSFPFPYRPGMTIQTNSASATTQRTSTMPGNDGNGLDAIFGYKSERN